jgi:hypothetical protein
MIAKSESPNKSRLSRPVVLLLLPSIVIVLTFLLVYVRHPVWNDEASYLTLAASIQNTGYPVWFWDPEKPELFLNSPPALLYFISFFPTWISSNVVWTRTLFSMLFGLTPFAFLAIRAFRTGASLFAIYATALFAACSGFFLLELVQIRLDLPLACLCCLVLVLYADASDCACGAERRSWLWLSLSSLFALSVLSFLTKFQAMCLAGALSLDVMLAYFSLRRRAISWLAFCTHMAGAGTAIAIFAWWSSFSEYGSSVALSNTIDTNVVGRIFPSDDLTLEITVLLSVAKQILVKTIVPITVLTIACVLGKIDWSERLFRLFALFAAMVVAFNLTVYRMPGAGNYYMTLATIPLGYILGRSFESLYASSQRSSATWALAALLVLHGVLNVPPISRALRPDVDRMVAKQIGAVLQSGDLLLLDNDARSRTIPFLLHRFDRYGFFFSIDPSRVENLLQRDGSGRVGALVFLEQSLAQLRSEKWSAVAALIGRKFFRAPQVGSPPEFVVFIRRDPNNSGGD